ncbi:MAG: archaeosine biosynthesis radical SAM protein RaSEA [Candidatus Methanofastidiosa archaeon]|nr:archaeosine biosynthesis radical SAM protein RaSEA [Candidatus Methanofastidiosa archaeon]
MASWTNEERFGDRIGTARSIVLDTSGCSYDRCYMCSYKRTCPDTTPASIVSDLEAALDGQAQKLKIFTSGSFFDKAELSCAQQEQIARIVTSHGFEELTVESRPEFITRETLAPFLSALGDTRLEVAMGLESANDDVLRYCINKGFTFSSFEKKARYLRENGCLVKAYLLLKPPFLTEYEAMLDVLDSAKAAAPLSDTISINPVSIHKDTVVEQLWKRGGYRPPYLWTLVACLNTLSGLGPYILSHPVAGGKARGIHNCGACDGDILKKIEAYNLHETPIEHSCACREEWEHALNESF